jgi:dipeptidase
MFVKKGNNINTKYSLNILKMKKLFIVITLLLFMGLQSNACTNFLVTKGASTDGSCMISYAADSHLLYGELYYWPAAKYPAGSMLDVYEWDTGKYLGQIKQATETYKVVGNMNEHQVAIGETTYGGRDELGSQAGAIMDYGSLIYITLQRAKTAREAIIILGGLMEDYGYYSSGESFSIADKDEVWIMELIGKGEGEKGAVWVALRVPDGYVCAHANQARITTFPLADGKKSITFEDKDKANNPEVECIYAADVISFAREKGFIDKKVKDKNFSFSDTYAPVGFGGARFCEIRVWAMFKDVSNEIKNNKAYFDYAKGIITHDENTHYANNRMPLWIKPDQKISVHDMMNFMRDHLEGTELDMRKDMGAGAFECPYRWRPLTWKVDDVAYCNERATATQQTGFSFITQSRNWLPDAIGGINWFSVDDAASTVYVPIYCGVNTIPETFAHGNGELMEYSETSAFWIFNLVSNLAYTRYNMIHPEIAALQNKLETKFIALIPAIDIGAAELYKTDQNLAIEYITEFSVNQANNTVYIWKDFFEYLFMKYMDGNVKEAADPKDGYKYVVPKLEQPGYGEDWYRKIIEETGDQFKVIGDAH